MISESRSSTILLMTFFVQIPTPKDIRISFAESPGGSEKLTSFALLRKKGLRLMLSCLITQVTSAGPVVRFIILMRRMGSQLQHRQQVRIRKSIACLIYQDSPRTGPE